MAFHARALACRMATASRSTLSTVVRRARVVTAARAVAAQPVRGCSTAAAEEPVDWTTVLPDNLHLHNPADAFPSENSELVARGS